MFVGLVRMSERLRCGAMDPLGDLLDGVRARTAAFCQALLEPPWALRIMDEAPLALATPLRGHAWVITGEGPPTPIEAGDVAIIQGPEPYVVADHPATAPSVFVHPGNRLIMADGTDITATMRLGSNTHALEYRDGDAGPDTATALASGTYQVSSFVSARLLAALPRVLRVPHDRVRSPIMDLLYTEVNRDAPGQQVVLDRLLDLALIATLRAWFAAPAAEAPGWRGFPAFPGRKPPNWQAWTRGEASNYAVSCAISPGRSTVGKACLPDEPTRRARYDTQKGCGCPDPARGNQPGLLSCAPKLAGLVHSDRRRGNSGCRGGSGPQ